MKKIICSILLVIAFASCKKKEQLGPDLVGIYGPVTITESLAVNTSNVNFAGGDQVFFTAKFKNDAVWSLTIVGTNGAQKIISGISKEINAENSRWSGTADVLPSFGAGVVTATLSFQNDAQTESVTFTITQKRNADLPGDVLVSNFVVNKRYFYSAPPPPIIKFGYTGPNGWPSDYPNISNTDNSYPKPDGDTYLIMSGIPWAPVGKPITPYTNSLTIMSDSSDFQYGKYFPLYADPDKVYFNIMICGTNTPHTWLEVNLIEDGPNGDIIRKISYKPNWTGWKLFSYKYSDLALGSPLLPNPKKIKGVQLVLLSDTPNLPGDEVKIGIDHITFTHNAPYQP
jgi:hypothetical protein